MSVLPGAAGVDTGDSGVREEEEGGERSEGNGAEERERSHGREEKRREEARKGNGVCYLSDLEKESYEHQAVALQFANGSGFSSVTHDLPREKG